MKFPAEIRNTIYTHIVHHNVKQGDQKWRAVRLAKVSRQVRHEAMHIYHGNATFRIPFGRLKSWMEMIEKGYDLRSVKNVKVLMPPNFYTISSTFHLDIVLRLQCITSMLGLPSKISFVHHTYPPGTPSHDSPMPKLNERLARINLSTCIALMASCPTWPRVLANCDGHIRRIDCKGALWLNYDDLKFALGAKADFKLTVCGKTGRIRLWVLRPDSRQVGTRNAMR
ncbi:hypothetical protein EJ08DRAFT_332685 [Tothia fuscella]|uniref:Uncharacterized protein n=1 Tax=Tothia fuscella TaxID=1048955 RepID=A0A9P4NN89_9PEZI|nr:hypothetical protein EJ08DRAFT_332685 [Tothia fuscella]